MKTELEINFLNRGNIIISLRNPTKEKVLETFDELMERGEGEDEFDMDAGFRWKGNGTGGYLQIECGILSDRYHVAETYDDVQSNMRQTKIPPLIEKLRKTIKRSAKLNTSNN